MNGALPAAMPSTPDAARDVFAVVITYRPQLAILQDLLERIGNQVGQVLVFDNATPDPDVARHLDALEARGFRVMRSPANVGLGAAMNRAADEARAGGFRYLLLFDQDSLPDPGMVSALKAALEDLRRQQPVAAVGPQFRDSRTGRAAPFVRNGFPLNRKIVAGPGERVACDFLISSGTLLPLDTLAVIGGMDEGLFIDNVDMEWCFRARHRGFGLFGVHDAQMRHSIGDNLKPSRLRPGGIPIHKPLRLYYIMRNRVVLYGRQETPRIWIAQDIPRLLLKFVGTALFLAPRGQYLRCMLQGLRDGLRGVSGPIPESLR
jgi:rhamnosyltransferase